MTINSFPPEAIYAIAWTGIVLFVTGLDWLTRRNKYCRLAWRKFTALAWGRW